MSLKWRTECYCTQCGRKLRRTLWPEGRIDVDPCATCHAKAVIETVKTALETIPAEEDTL